MKHKNECMQVKKCNYMDAGVVGALIGLGIMAVGGASLYLYDIYKKYSSKKISQVVAVVQKSSMSATSESPVSWVRAPLHEILPSFR